MMLRSFISMFIILNIISKKYYLHIYDTLHMENIQDSLRKFLKLFFQYKGNIIEFLCTNKYKDNKNFNKIS